MNRLFLLCFAALPWSVIIGAAIFVWRRYRISFGIEDFAASKTLNDPAAENGSSAADSAENSKAKEVTENPC